MQNRTHKFLTYVIAGVAYLSGHAFAASDSLKSKSASGAPAATGASPAGATQTGAPPAGAPPAASGQAQPGMQAAQPLTDAQILGVVNAVDEHEIEASTKALKQKMSTEASAFAKMLKEQHTANREATKKLSKTLSMKPAASPVADSLRAKGKAGDKAVAAKKGAEFEKAYIDAMVNGHTEALAIIDTSLMPSASSEAVRSHLTEFRGHVSAHLEQGKRLQGAAASVTPQ